MEIRQPQNPTEQTTAGDPGAQTPTVKAEPEDISLEALLEQARSMTREPEDDVDMEDTEAGGSSNRLPDTQDMDYDDEEGESKPVLHLRYRGYTIADVCLAIIVEPYNSGSRAGTREPSTAPASGAQSRYVGIRTTPRLESEAPEAPGTYQKPLFLEPTPEPESRFQSEAPPRRTYPPVPLFHEETPAPGEGDEDDSESNLIQFSQAMNRATTRTAAMAGGAEEDDDDVDALYGDADEGR